jgi:hypothetical protein
MEILSQPATYDERPEGVEKTISTYRASWVDLLFDWIRTLQFSSWLFYLGFCFALILLLGAVAWLEGETSEYNLLIAFDGAMYITYYLALMHYLDGTAGRALRRFRPLLQVNDEEFARLHYELTTLPARPTLVAGGVGVLVTLASMPFVPDDAIMGMGRLISRPSLQLGFIAGNAVIFTFFYHTIHQLRVVSRIHATVTRVNLFRREPAYAFSQLTARTGLGWILALSIGLMPRIGPLLTNQGHIWLWAPLLPLAVLLFVLPLASMHGLLVREKRHLQEEVEQRIEVALQKLHAQMDAGELATIGGVKTLMDSLTVERDLLAKIPTWPWKAGTLTGFISALLLPVSIWFFQQLLMDLIKANLP